MNHFPLKLHKTYYNQGFFNLRVDWDRIVRKDNGPVVIELLFGHKLEWWVDRSANPNGTARVFGRVELRNWFQRHYRQGDVVEIILDPRQNGAHGKGYKRPK